MSESIQIRLDGKRDYPIIPAIIIRKIKIFISFQSKQTSAESNFPLTRNGGIFMKIKILRLSRRTISLALALLLTVSVLGLGTLNTVNAVDTAPAVESASEEESATVETAETAESLPLEEDAAQGVTDEGQSPVVEPSAEPTEAAAEPAPKAMRDKKGVASTGASSGVFATGDAVPYYCYKGNGYSPGVPMTSLGDGFYCTHVDNAETFYINGGAMGLSNWTKDHFDNNYGDTGNSLSQDQVDTGNIYNSRANSYIMLDTNKNKVFCVKNNPVNYTLYKNYAKAIDGSTNIMARYGRVLFNTSASGWTAQNIYLVVGHRTHIKAYHMSQINDTTWYELNVLNDSNGFGDARYFAFVGTSTALSTTYTDSTYAVQYTYYQLLNESNIVNYSDAFDPLMGTASTSDDVLLNNTGNTYYFKATSSGNLCTITGKYVNPSGQFTYSRSNNVNTISAWTAPTDFDGCLIVPHKIDGYPVTAISDNAFQNKSSILSTIIPGEVASGLGQGVFNGCVNLNEAIICSGVTNIRYALFEGCTALERVSLGNGVQSIANYSFNRCSNLKSINIPNSVTQIQEKAFQDCITLSSVTINSNATLGNNLFNNCTSLNQVTLLVNSDMTNLNTDVFTGSPSNLVVFGYNANNTAKNRNRTFIPIDGTNAENGFKYSTTGMSSGKICITGYNNAEDSRTNLVIPTYRYQNSTLYKVTKIDNNAFSDISYIKYVTIPDTVTDLNQYAFANCSGIRHISLPDSVTNIGYGAFQSCSNLENVIIPTANIATNAFHSCSNLKSVTILNSSADVNGAAFDNSSNLTIFGYKSSTAKTWRDSHTNVTFVPIDGTEAENGFTYTTTNMPLGTIKLNGFVSNFERVKLAIPPYRYQDGKLYKVTMIKDHAFSGKYSITSLTIPDTVYSIDQYAFSGCNGIVNVTLPASVIKIEYGAFYQSEGLTSVSFGNKISRIENSVFQDCTSLSSVIIPDNVTLLGNNLFTNTALTSVTIPASVTVIGCNAFNECLSLTNITVAAGNANYCDISGVLYDSSRTELITYPAGRTAKTYTIPSGTTSLEQFSFARTQVESVIMPSSLETIGIYAFYLGSLLEAEIPNSVTSIGERAFYATSLINGVSFQNTSSLTSIGDGAFAYTRFPSIVIPKSVNNIGENAFNTFDNCKSITILSSNADIESNSFKNSESQGLTIYGYYSSTARTWKNNYGSYVDFVPIDDFQFSSYDSDNDTCTVARYTGSASGSDIPANLKIPPACLKISDPSDTATYTVTAIGISAFQDSTTVTSVTIPDTVTTLGRQIFYGCTSLTSVQIGSGVTTISNGMFKNCTSLTSVTIPNNVTTIDDYAFDGCTGLTTVYIPSGVTSIEWRSFNDCTGITNIYVNGSTSGTGSNFKAIDGNLYSSNGSILVKYAGGKTATSFDVPNGVTYIKAYAFDGANNLQVVKFPASVATFGQSCLKNASSLQQAWIYNTSAYIPDDSFSNTSSLTFYGYIGSTADTYQSTRSIGFVPLDEYTVNINAGSNGTLAGGNISPSVGVINSVALPTANPNTGYHFVNWTSTNNNVTITNPTSNPGATIKATGTGTVTAIFAETTHTITITNDGHGTTGANSISAGQHTAVPLPSVTPAANYTFDKWVVVSDNANATLYNASDASTATIKATGTATVQATFKEKLYSVTVSAGAHGSVASGSVNAGALTWVNLPAVTADDGYEFAGWTSTGSVSLSNASSASSQVKATGTGGTVTATFRETLYSVSVNAGTGGTVDSSSVDAGKITAVTLPTARPDTGYVFSGWTKTGSVTIESGQDSASNGKIKATGTGGTVTANFTEPKYTVTVSTGVGGSLSDTTALSVGNANNVKLPNAIASAGYSFVRWEVISGSVTITTNAATNGYIKATTAGEIRAIFRDDVYDYSYNTTTHKATVSNYRGSGGAVIIPSTCPNIDDPTHTYTVTGIGTGAFADKSAVTSVTIPDTVTSIGNNAFTSCSGLTGITLPSGVTSIGGGAFNGCSSLASINIPSGVTSILAQTFQNCSSLTGITIPNAVTSIGNSAFFGCTNLATATIGSGVTRVEESAFNSCTSLTSINFPSGVNYIALTALNNCTSLANISIGGNVNGSNAYYNAIDGNLYNAAGTTLIQYALGKTDSSIELSSSVTRIINGAFQGNDNLREIIVLTTTSMDVEKYSFRSTNENLKIYGYKSNLKLIDEASTKFRPLYDVTFRYQDYNLAAAGSLIYDEGVENVGAAGCLGSATNSTRNAVKCINDTTAAKRAESVLAYSNVKSNYYNYSATTSSGGDGNTLSVTLTPTVRTYTVSLNGTELGSYTYQHRLNLTGPNPSQSYEWVVDGETVYIGKTYALYVNARTTITTIPTAFGSIGDKSVITNSSYELKYSGSTPQLTDEFYIQNYFDKADGKTFVGGGVVFKPVASDDTTDYSTAVANTISQSVFNASGAPKSDYVGTAYNSTTKFTYSYTARTDSRAKYVYSNSLHAYHYIFALTFTNDPNNSGKNVRMYSYYIYHDANGYHTVISENKADSPMYRTLND